GYGVHTSRITPLNPPDILGGNKKSSSLPFIRGGLGWGKTLVLTGKGSWVIFHPSFCSVGVARRRHRLTAL
ncbi:hypothetical protein, partial [Nostoc commune]|uniref:hypothetical protein n=1 Tax=Nostoc commune TaxID=1178 RepID=UPI001E4D3518